MPSYDERTPSGWPLPFKSNTLEFDVERLRETLFLIDEALSAFRKGTKTLLDERVAGLEEKQFILDDRMDVIAGQTTEDTEILDARVDANSETHPNLGHNIRNIHSKLLELKAEIERKESELRTYIEEADSELREHADEKDTELHEYIEASNSEQALKNAELERYTKELAEYESRRRKETDETLSREISQSGEAIIETNLMLDWEINERRKSDAELSERNDELQDSLNAEKEHTAQRFSEYGENLERETTELKEELQTELSDETRTREASDNMQREHEEILQGQIDELSELGMRQVLKLHTEHEERKETESELRAGISKNAGAVQEETKARVESEAELSERITENATAITDEIRKRENSDAHAEIIYRGQEELSEAIIQTAISSHEGLKIQKERLQSERSEREAEDVKLHEEIELSHEVLSKHSQERDAELLRGIDELSAGMIQNTAALQHEAEQRRKLENVVAGIKSPVDWSKSTSLQIPEPRCAIVNITGINSMPTSKTAELNAFMEFWDMQGNYFRKKITCAAQGNSSLGYVKKNVKFDLLNEDGSEFNLKIGSWPVQDGFHLKAYYTDFFRGVGAVSYKVCDEIMRFNGILRDRPYKKILLDMSSIKTSGTALNNPEDLTLQTDTGALCHPDGFPCIVYLNGIFYGIFAWQIKKHRANYHLEKSKVEHIHLDGTLYTQYFWDGNINWTAFEIRNPNKLYTMNGKKYDGDAPKELIDETSENYDPENKDHVRSAQVKKYIQDFVKRFGELKAAPDKEKYEELFDWENQRDYMIFSDIVRNSDGFGKNWQWFTYDGVKWFVGAYDLDMSFGGHWQGITITAPLTGHINTSTALPSGYTTRLYASELEERYRELRDAGIIDADHIARMLEDWTKRISTENYELEYERWPNSPCINYYTDSIYRVRKWLDAEIANMDKVYHYVPEREQILSGVHAEIDEKVQIEREQRQAKEESIENYALMETEERKSVNSRLVNEINALGELNLHQELELRNIRQVLKEWITAANVLYEMAAETGNLTYKGARIASGNEITSMLSDVMTGNDSGEVIKSEIPEELRDQITTPEETTEMLSEIFPNN